MELDVLARAVALRERREPFAMATVVWRRSPSSGHLGSKAVILSDGSMQGWLGGACAQPTVVQQALAAMSDGRSRLLLLGQPDDLGVRPDDGILKVPMACESEGAMEIYLEPVLPAPQVRDHRSVAGRVHARAAGHRSRVGRGRDRRRGRPGRSPPSGGGADPPGPERPGRRAGHGHRHRHAGPLRRPGAGSGAADRRRLRRPDRGREASVGHPRAPARAGCRRRPVGPGDRTRGPRPGPGGQRRDRGGGAGRAGGPAGGRHVGRKPTRGGRERVPRPGVRDDRRPRVVSLSHHPRRRGATGSARPAAWPSSSASPIESDRRRASTRNQPSRLAGHARTAGRSSMR